MSEQAGHWQSPTPAGRLLAEFGLVWEDVRDRVLVRAHNLARPFNSISYPPGSYGQMRYMEGVRLLTELLRPKGWTANREDQVCRLISPSRDRALVLQIGDPATGTTTADFGRDPRTKYPKGEALRRAILHNQPLLPLWDDEPETGQVEGHVERLQTWFLLTRVDRFGLKSELSLPNSTNSSGYVDAWRDRILFPTLEVDIETLQDFGQFDDGDDIDIPVDPK